MSTFLIFLHAAAAILLVGTVCVVTSAFPSQLLKAAAGDTTAKGAASVLNRITTTYGYISAIVPILGIGVFLSDLSAYKSEVKFHIAILVAIIAWCLLFFLVIPKQNKAIALIEGTEGTEGTGQGDVEGLKKQLGAFSGIFNLLWIVCLILMYL